MFKFLSSVYQESKLNQWINVLSVSFLLITGIRVLEWNLTLSNHTVSHALNSWELLGLFHDYFIISVLISGLALIFGLLSFLNVKLARFISLGLIFNVLLVLYFMESLTTLSVSDIYGMSKSQVEFISDIYGFKMVYLFGLIPAV